jgi:hypothetical protein
LTSVITSFAILTVVSKSLAFCFCNSSEICNAKLTLSFNGGYVASTKLICSSLLLRYESNNFSWSESWGMTGISFGMRVMGSWVMGSWVMMGLEVAEAEPREPEEGALVVSRDDAFFWSCFSALFIISLSSMDSCGWRYTEYCGASTGVDLVADVGLDLVVEARLDAGEARMDAGEARLDAGETRLDVGETRLGAGEADFDLAAARAGGVLERLDDAGEARLGGGASLALYGKL